MDDTMTSLEYFKQRQMGNKIAEEMGIRFHEAVIGAIMGSSVGSIFPIKEMKIQKAKLEILAEYGIENITDDIDAESEYKAVVAEIMSEKSFPLVLGGTSDSVQNNGWDYKRMFERPQYDAFENQWKWQPLELQEPRYLIGVDDYYKECKPVFKLPEESEYEKSINSFMKTKAKEYVEQNA